MYFKHKTLTNPTVTPEDAVVVVTAAQQLTQTLKGKIATGNDQLEELQRVAKVFNDIATSKAATAEASKVHNNGITHSNQTLTSNIEEAPYPRGDSSPTPKETTSVFQTQRSRFSLPTAHQG